MQTYAGIGSRSTPRPILDFMTELAAHLARRNYHLYSGGAPGADTAFYQGAATQGMNYSIFIPWEGFNGHYMKRTGFHYGVGSDARKLARSHHPHWNRLSHWVQDLHARNCYQILGADLKSPVQFVVCWTPDGAETATTKDTGGTGQAIRLAVAHHIPVFNLRNAATFSRIAACIGRCVAPE